MERCSFKPAPMLRTLLDELTTSSPIVGEAKDGLGRNWEEKTVSSAYRDCASICCQPSTYPSLPHNLTEQLPFQLIQRVTRS